MENNKFLDYWLTKNVSYPDEDGFLCKYERTDTWHEFLDYEEQLRRIELKKQYFWKYLPETQLIRHEDWSYHIRQKYIKGKLLKNINISSLSWETLWELLDFLLSYIRYWKTENLYLDIFWYQKGTEYLSKNEKRFVFTLMMYDNFLRSSNIIISDEGHVYMVDVCDTKDPVVDNDIWRKMRIRVKEFLLEKWINRTIFRIKAEKKKKSQALVDVLK